MFRWLKPLIYCIFLVASFTSCNRSSKTPIVLHPSKTGIVTLRLYDETRERPILTEVWYPIDDNIPAQSVQGLWVRCAEARDAPLKHSKAQYPLIVMSHGNGGDRMHNAWLAEILAANGYIVASMDHHGNTWNNNVAECFVKIWERPKDVSFVVDQLLQHDQFGPCINDKKIGFIGYSLGGQTGIWIAGGQINDFGKSVMDTIPVDQLPHSFNDEIFDEIDCSPARECYRDSRISAIFVMAPALGFLFDLDSLQSISVPVYIVASEADKIVPIDSSARILASKIKKAAFKLLPGSANHYVFMNEVSKGGKMLLDKRVALDPPDVDRGRIHDTIGQSAVKFFNNHLK